VSIIVFAGGKVYLACRSTERAKIAADEIRNATGVAEDKIHIMHLDLESLDSIRSFAAEFKSSKLKFAYPIDFLSKSLKRRFL
jgi:NAD(P)-dependent dehydrogenase (short-subunit alcohol dehydrogenase family)